MMKTILVATDFSPAADNAVRYAVEYAAATNSRLIVFHAAHMPQFKPTISEADFFELRRNGERRSEEKLRRMVDRIYNDGHLAKSKSKVSVAVNTGVFAADMVLAKAKNFNVDLIIVGTHGDSGLKFIGSTTSEIMFKAEVPVISVPPRYKFKGVKHVVYATDLRNMLNELKRIVPIAKDLKASIEVLNLDFGGSKVASKEGIERAVKQSGYKKVVVVVEKEKKGLTILEQLEKHLVKSKPDMLAMFPEERSLFDKIFVRSKTEVLAYHTKIPLLTIVKSSVPL